MKGDSCPRALIRRGTLIAVASATLVTAATACGSSAHRSAAAAPVDLSGCGTVDNGAIKILIPESPEELMPGHPHGSPPSFGG